MTAPTAGPRPIERQAVSLRDPDAAHAEIGRSYFQFRTARVADPERFEYRTGWAAGGALRLHSSEYRNRLEAETEPIPNLGVITSTGGRVIVDNGREECRNGTGESYLCIPGLPLSMRSDHPAAIIPALSYPDVLDAAAAVTEHTSTEFRFLAMAPVSPALEAYWGRLVRLARSQLTGPNTTYYPLVTAELYRMLVASVLQVFPNSTMTGLAPAGPGHVAPNVVRRAMDHIEAHADRPLTLHDIAAAVGVGPRGLQHAFRRYEDVTPMAYLRRVRLQRAHAELQQADPASGVTVAAVAARHGFGHPGRFSRRYAEMFDQPPSQTLAGG